VRLRRFSGVVILAIGLGFAAGPPGAGAADEPVPPLVTTLQSVVDGAADVINTITSSVFDNPRADITGASVEYAPGWIRMKVQVKNGTDPLKDDAWSDRSDAEWVLDTDADGMPDYTVEFASDKGELYGAVFDVAKPDEKSACDADSASYSPQDGYTLVIDPACIGKPQKLGYAVAMFFDTNPKDDKAPMATDRVPDQGFKEVAAPVQPGGTPPPAAAPGTPTAPAAAPPASSAPGAPAPKPGSATAHAPRGAAAPPAPGSPVPDTAAAPSTGGSPTSPAPAALASPLARTGSASTEHGLLGLGIMLLGAGLLVMTRPTTNRAVIVR
jgi:hypothetical protein